MLYQVIGVERKTGDFTPRDGSNRQIHYDNLVLHSVTLKRLVGCAGQKAEQCIEPFRDYQSNGVCH